ncbi:succinate dehydrogenase/fumarate reductase iron-sulfur subunit [Pandoraea communis]|uniref:succinate dehydrogenase/fumarate reductase iron-sulfur subunit n=1 Tax=Pandoraea communis TaxID=2508297 RepID=UPI0025A4CDC1|nr:2Fe-2S iron-sulfur cluster-binding protein [Pandoraea communis]MDM8358392.1 2Fe-2S iron-sulfur cluster-binding protein [Pandoraea communis]
MHSDVRQFREDAASELAAVTLHISRFDPETDAAPYVETYVVPHVRHMRIIDALNYVQETLAVDIGYRWYCGTKKCGTCAARVNGREVLMCWEAAEAEMHIEPLRHLPRIRDLAVDRSPVEAKLVSLQTWLQRSRPYGGFPEAIDAANAASLRATMDCLSCLACYSACPVLDFPDDIAFAGPAPLVHLARVALDARDDGARLQAILDEAQVHHCVSCYQCEAVCPAGIPIVSAAIEPLKQLAYAQAREASPHARTFMDIVARRGRIEPMLLVLGTRGWRAVLQRPGRTLKLMLRGKVKPLAALLRRPVPGIKTIRRIFFR